MAPTYNGGVLSDWIRSRRSPALRGQSQPSAGEAEPWAWLLRLWDLRVPAIFIGLAAAVLLPAISLSGRLPDVRLEQLLLPYAILVLWIGRRRGTAVSSGYIDWVFAALAVSTLTSILLAPVVVHTRLSPRDFYELLKLALYYALFRLAAGAIVAARDRRRLLDVLLGAGSVSAAFGVAQYFDWFRINSWLSPRYAPDHHLSVLRASGRVVGTVGNPNYFGILCAILALAALLTFWLRDEQTRTSAGSAWATLQRLSSWLPLLAAPLASLGIVMSGSRTAVLALGVALVALCAFALLSRSTGHLPRLAAGTAALLMLILAAVAVVEAFPRGQVDYVARVGGGLNAGDDASFGLRLARWRSLFDSWLPGKSAAAIALHTTRTVTHATGLPAGAAVLVERDERRKADLLSIASAIDSFYGTTGRSPDPNALAADLVPRFLQSLPVDPQSGEAYSDVAVASGYSLMAHLENPADPDYPTYGIGSSPNYLLNGDLERGDSRPSNWDTISGTLTAIQRGDSLYGDSAVLFRGGADRPNQRTGIYQQRYFGRPGGDPYTASVWIKLLAAESGQLELYANVIYTDGERADPLTRLPADMTKTGIWQRVSLWMQPPAGKSVGFLGIYVVSDGFRGQALLDGFQLVDGPVPLSFAITREAPPAGTLGFNPDAMLRRSPIIGVGPQKGEQGSSLDDEYLLYAARYGVVGIALYLALYIGTLTLAVRAFVQHGSPLTALVALSVLAFLVFNITAGSFYELQLMAIFWLLGGAALADSRV